MNVTVIGLGNIGSGVAKNLLAAGHQVSALDLDPTKIQAAVALGATAAPDLETAVVGANVVITSLPGPAQIAAISEALLDAVPSEAIWIELSTNDVDLARELAQAAANRSIGFLDAPVSGGPEGADAGTLSVYVGGSDAAFAKAEPVLHAIGSRVDHLGPVGSGLIAKTAQVTLCYTQTVTLIEAWLLGVKGGVDPAKMLDVIQNSAGTSYCAMSYGPEILAGGYDASFPLGHATKDLRLAMTLAESIGAALPFTSEVADLYERAIDAYGADAGHCQAIQLIESANDTILHAYHQEDLT